MSYSNSGSIAQANGDSLGAPSWGPSRIRDHMNCVSHANNPNRANPKTDPNASWDDPWTKPVTDVPTNTPAKNLTITVPHHVVFQIAHPALEIIDLLTKSHVELP